MIMDYTIAKVIISGAARTFDKIYDYSIPANLIGSLKVGCRVLVGFGNSKKLREGLCVELAQKSEFDNLKPIVKIIDVNPVLFSEQIELIKWMKNFYLCTYYQCIKCMLPAGTMIKPYSYLKINKETNENPVVNYIKDNGNIVLEKVVEDRFSKKEVEILIKENIIKREVTYIEKVKSKYQKAAELTISQQEASNLIEDDILKSIQQIKIIEALIDNGTTLINELCSFYNVSRAVIKTLEKKGYLKIIDKRIERISNGNSVYEQRTIPHNPTIQQSKAINSILKIYKSHEYLEILLRGVTGSGKTEVYMQVMQKIIKDNRQVLVLVPEIALTPQITSVFEKRFGQNVAILHSRLSLGERFDQWERIKNDKVDIVIGARSAIFAPLKRIGMIIIDEEHEHTYKSEIIPKYNVKQIAFKRAQWHNAIVLYGSATPSVENYYRASIGKIKLLEMTKRANNSDLPEVIQVDMKKEIAVGNKTSISNLLSKSLKETIEKKEQAIIFINRRGHSNFVVCKNCGILLKCPNCNLSLNYHKDRQLLMCHYCGYIKKDIDTCPSCKHDTLVKTGSGTQRIVEEIKQLIPESKILRMDQDTTTGKSSLINILDSFRSGESDILIGTQMIAKGHDFPNVTLAAIIGADSLLNTGDYKTSERAFQLITQSAGRSGRGNKKGKVIVQGYNLNDYAIKAALAQDYDAFFKEEIIVRKNLKLPPFYSIGIVTISHENQAIANSEANNIYNKIVKELENQQGFIISKPLIPYLYRLKNKFRYRIIIKEKSINKLQKLFVKLADYNKNIKKGIRISLDINPLSIN